MKYLTPIEKIRNSIINIFITILISMPLIYLTNSLLHKKLIIITIFFLLKSISIFRKDHKTLGMILTKTSWKEKYPKHKHILHSIFYTISFSTIMFYIWFPLDIFSINIFLLQLPSMIKNKMTFHEFISGKMMQVKSN